MISDKLSKTLLNTVRALGNEKIKAVVFIKNPRQFRAVSRFNVVREYPFISAVGVECEAAALEPLASVPAVEFVTSCAKVSTFFAENNFDAAEAFSYSGGLTGRGVRLAVLDTGVSPHLDFCLPDNRIIDFYDTVGGLSAAYDDNGHGTFVAGVAAGNGLTGGGKYKGLATSAEIVAVKVIGADGEGGAFSVLDGMQWLLDNLTRLDIKVCCMSFGSTPQEINDPLRRGAETLVRNGITVVAASGNSGRNGLKSPAISPEVIGVGAVNNSDVIADFTSRGMYMGRRKPEVYADGVDVISVAGGGVYAKMSGTSVAAPYVAGACCLLYEKYGDITPRRIKEMLLSSCKTVDGIKILRLD